MTTHIVILVMFLSVGRLSQQKSFEELQKLEDKLDVYTDQCMKENNIDSLPEDSSEEDEIDDKDMQCFIKCRYVKEGIMTEDGEMKMEQINKVLDSFKNCNDQKGANPCEIATRIFKCNREVYEELGLMLYM